MTRKLKKRLNGEGNSITLNFNANDPEEAAALAMSKRLAGLKKGKRKDFIIAMLAAAERLYQETGQLIETYEIAAAIMSSPGASGRSAVSIPPTQQMQVEANPRQSGARQQLAGIEVTNLIKGNSQNVANNFLNSMKGLASGFFD